jgi:NAD(P)-dependent dehydrogenase (short-subunit alcohol dehydrogenase family)
VEELLSSGVERVYAAARNPDTVDITDDRVVPIRLDITKPDDVRAAASRCADVTVLINNAGAMLRTPLLAAPDLSAAKWKPITLGRWRCAEHSHRCWPKTAAPR